MKDAKNEKELYLEIWNKEGYVESLKLPDVSLVYNDTVFGGISWSKSKKKIAFISEKPETKAFRPFWNSEAPQTDPEKLKEEEKMTSFSEKFNYESTFGETLSNKKLPILTVYDLEKKQLTWIDLKDVDKDLFIDCYPASPIFDESENGIIFHAYHSPHAKLGLNFCHNKVTKLYYIPNYSGKVEKTNDELPKEEESKMEKKEEKKEYGEVKILSGDDYMSCYP